MNPGVMNPGVTTTHRRLLAAILAVVALVLASCGGAAAPSTAPSASAPSASAPSASAPSASAPSASAPASAVSGGEITVALITSPTNDAIQSLIPQFTSETGIKVNVVSADWTSGHQKELLAFQSKKGLYDVVQFDDPYLPAFAAGGFLEPLDDFLQTSQEYGAKDIPQPILDYGKFKGTTYALDLSSEPYLFWYRTDLFNKAGLKLPATWEEYVANAKAIQDAKLGSGQVMGLSKPSSLPFHWLQMVWSYGGDLVDANNKPTVNTPKAIAGTTVLKEMVPYSPSSALTASDDDVVSIFCQQDVGEMISYSGYFPVVKDPKQCKVGQVFDVSVVPAGPASNQVLLEGWHIGVPSDSKNKPQAMRFLEWMLGKSHALALLDAGAAAIARYSLANDPSVTAKYSYLPILIKTAEVARPTPRLTQLPEVTQAITNRVEDILSGSSSVQDGLDKLQSDLEGILK